MANKHVTTQLKYLIFVFHPARYTGSPGTSAYFVSSGSCTVGSSENSVYRNWKSLAILLHGLGIEKYFKYIILKISRQNRIYKTTDNRYFEKVFEGSLQIIYQPKKLHTTVVCDRYSYTRKYCDISIFLYNMNCTVYSKQYYAQVG